MAQISAVAFEISKSVATSLAFTVTQLAVPDRHDRHAPRLLPGRELEYAEAGNHPQCLRVPAMLLSGHVENGHIILDTPVVLPDGTQVTVAVQSNGTQELSNEPLPSLFDRLQSVVGKAKGLSADLAINHDHYLHGQAKRQ
jgi:hypothetical protein